MKRFAAVLFAALAIALAVCPPAGALDLERVADGFVEPTYVTSEPADANRLYVTERSGRIWLVTPNGRTEFADLRALTGQPTYEAGLLSVALPPDFASSGLLYAYFVDTAGNIRIAELSVSPNGASAELTRTVLEIPHADDEIHFGGQLQFGPDGFLYASTGDGGGVADEFENAQDLGSLLGKVIRIDPRGTASSAYTVPADNPFVGAAGARPEIWSYGLRNPHRFSFDRSTGDLIIGDVGEGNWEEIDYATWGAGGGRGVNWGWPCREGARPFSGPACRGSEPVDPIHEYNHNTGDCAVIGGFVVRDPGLRELYGRYVYGDFCGDWIRSIVLLPSGPIDDRQEVLGPLGTPISFGEDACGRVYVTNYNGAVSRLVDATPTDCAAVTQAPAPRSGECGRVVPGGAGSDSLRGGPGPQDVLGRAGKDELRGDGGNDCVNGGKGRDRLRGGEGRDTVRGGPGRDLIISTHGGRDIVICGPGRDTAAADRKDRLRGCERDG